MRNPLPTLMPVSEVHIERLIVAKLRRYVPAYAGQHLVTCTTSTGQGVFWMPHVDQRRLQLRLAALPGTVHLSPPARSEAPSRADATRMLRHLPLPQPGTRCNRPDTK